MALPNVSELTECPNCGHDEFYSYQKVSGIIAFNQRFDGGEADNSHMHDDLTYGKSQKTVYCTNCQEKIARYNLDEQEGKKEE